MNSDPRTCNKCGKNERGEHGKCLPCRRERMRNYSKTEDRIIADRKHGLRSNRLYKKNQRDQVNAGQAVYFALKMGRLVKSLVCQLCWVEGEKLQGHHQDYSKRLDVVWLCSMCHAHVHGRGNVPELLSRKQVVS